MSQPPAPTSPLAQLRELVLRLAKAQEQLQMQLDEVGAVPPAVPGLAKPCEWRGAELERPEEQVQVLDDWVRWLTSHYPLDAELPECWAEHPALVEELDALRSAHAAAYLEGGHPSDPLTWHQAIAAAKVLWPQWNVSRCAGNAYRGP